MQSETEEMLQLGRFMEMILWNHDSFLPALGS